METFETIGLVDIHNHLVPGVDDGCKSVEESLRHLRLLAGDGVVRLAVSPHLNAARGVEERTLRARLAELRRGFETLRAACEGRDDVPALVFGQEVLTPTARVARRAMREKGIGIAGTRYVLIELGFRLAGEDAGEAVAAAAASERRPILAHPERYHRGDDLVALDEIRGWKQAGALLQVNAGSLLGRYGDAIAGQAWRLLEAGLADLVATDHHGDYRPVSPAEAARRVAERLGPATARLLFCANPGRILDDLDVEAAPPGPAQAA